MTSFDMTESIAPRSDQANAEDFLTGPRTVTIVEVRRGSVEQPVDVVLAEFGPARPFKPSKTVRRLMVAAWGADTTAYAGKRMTLYRDPAVRFGGQDVGGIRVSHMSGLDKPLTIALTVTRGKRAPYVVKPLEDAPPTVEQVSRAQLTAMGAAFTAANVTDRTDRLAWVVKVIGRDVASPNDLTPSEATTVVDSLRDEPASDGAA